LYCLMALFRRPHRRLRICFPSNPKHFCDNKHDLERSLQSDHTAFTWVGVSLKYDNFFLRWDLMAITWIELTWIELNWTGLNWIELDWIL
jgi:hypothetical protein